MKRLAFLAAAAIALSAAAVGFAQPPSPRTACAADIAKLCPNAHPGDGSIRQCMQAHQADLSAGCKQAIAAMMAARQQSGGPHN